MPRVVPGVCRRLAAWAAPFLLAPALALLAIAGSGRALAAQHLISVPFTRGFIGVRGSSVTSADNVRSFATLEIARAFFIQDSPTGLFEQLQGNDVAGTLRLVRTSGAILDMPASATWRETAGGNTRLVGFIPRPASPVTLTYPGGSVQITDGTATGGSNIGGYIAGYTGATAADGSNVGGNSAQVREELNAYLARVQAQRPRGPVTVAALRTSNTRPTLGGTADSLAAGDQVSVVVAGVQYTTATNPAVVHNRVTGHWSLALAAPLAAGTYDVAATITDPDGFTLSDATQGELAITRTLTLAGSFTPGAKTYDGTTAVPIGGSSLSLVGVEAGHQVGHGTRTIAFTDPSAGTGKPVVITSYALTGADAGLYTVDLSAAPTSTGTVQPAELHVTGVAAASKVYDGTTAAALAGTPAYSGLQHGESFPVAGAPAAHFASAAVGQAKPVTVTGFAPPNANYTVVQPGPLAGHITARPLTVGGAFTAADKMYDGATTATIATNSLTLVGPVPGDTVALAGVTAAFATPSVEAGKTVRLTAAALAGSAAANYTLSLAGAPTAAASITPAGGTVTLAGALSADSKPYDGTVAATGATAGLTLAGVHAGHQVAITAVTLAFADPAAGAGKPVAVTGVTLGGPDAALYTVSLAGAPAAAAAITPRALTLTGTFAAADKMADGATAATVTGHALQLAGAVAGDAVGLGALTAAFADAAVGAHKPVALTGAALTGAAAPNYTLSLAGAPTTTASITAAAPPSAPVAVAATPGDRTLALAWSPPAASGCAPVAGYVAEVSTDAGSTWTRTALSAPGTLAGLVNNLAYQVRVAAVNACGTGPFAAAPAPVVPIAPTRDGAGQLATAAPGTATATAGGAPQPVTVEVVQDTVLRLSGGGVTLRLRAVDQPGAAIPLDTARTALLEHGGRAVSDGSGLTPGSVASVYLFAPGGAPQLLGTAPVNADGAFAASLPVPDTLRAGPYTLQVNGVDRAGAARTVSVGVEVAAPPPDLSLAATPDDPAPAVGDTITITLAVTNVGRGPAVDVVIPRAFEEPGFTILRATPVEGRYEDRTKTWTIPRIEVGAQARLRFTAVVLPPDAAEPAAVTASPSRP